MHCPPFFPAIFCTLFPCYIFSLSYTLVSIIRSIAPMNFDAINKVYKAEESILDIEELHPLIILGIFQG
jgi:hypothetical protein